MNLQSTFYWNYPTSDLPLCATDAVLTNKLTFHLWLHKRSADSRWTDRSPHSHPSIRARGVRLQSSRSSRRRTVVRCHPTFSFCRASCLGSSSESAALVTKQTFSGAGEKASCGQYSVRRVNKRCSVLVAPLRKLPYATDLYRFYSVNVNSSARGMQDDLFDDQLSLRQYTKTLPPNAV
jgi:hypothetical protein